MSNMLMDNGNRSAAPDWPAPARVGAGSPWDQARALIDRIPRRRNERGDRLPNWAVYHDPYPEPLPARETTLDDVLRLIAAERPARAGWLRHFHDHRLIWAWQVFVSARREAEAELAVWNARALELDRELDREQAVLREGAETASAPHRAAAEALEPDLEVCHAEAARLTAECGRRYDPDNPSDEDLLRADPRPLEVLAAELGLPDPRQDARWHWPGWLGWLLTLGVGLMIGISFGLVCGFLDTAGLLDTPGMLLLCGALGFAAAICMRAGITRFHGLASERSSLDTPWLHRAGWWAAAIGLDAAVLLLDSVVEREGILRLARADAGVAALSGGAGTAFPEWVGYVIALLVSLGYVAAAIAEGHFRGRSAVLANRLLRAQEAGLEARREAHHARPEVRAALAAIHAVREALRRVRVRQERAAAAAAPYEARIAAAEALRLPQRDDFTMEQQRRIQSEHDDLLGANGEFQWWLEREVARLEAGFWWWLPRWMTRRSRRLGGQ